MALLPASALARPVIEAPSCKPAWFERSRFEALLQVETASSSFERIRLKIPTCEAPLIVEVQAWTATSTAGAKISLHDVPPSTRLRALALAIAELRPAAQAKEAPEPAPSGQPTGVIAKRSMVPRFSVMGAFALHTYPGRQTTLLGGRLSLSLPLLLETLQASLDLGALGGRQAEALGQIEALTITMGLGLSLQHRLGPLSLGGGPRLELGWARLRGLSDDPEVNTGAAGGLISTAYLCLHLGYQLTPSLSASLTVMGGWVIRGFAAEGAAGISGGAIAAQVGLFWASLL